MHRNIRHYVKWILLTFVDNLHKEAESFGRLQFQLRADAAAEVLGTCARVHLKRHVGVVGKVDLVKDLCHLVLNRFYFHLVWRILTTAIPTKSSIYQVSWLIVV